MKYISEIEPQFLEKYTLTPKWKRGEDPFILLAEEKQTSAIATQEEYCATTHTPLLPATTLPSFTRFSVDPELPIIYPELTPGGTLTLYTTLPIKMSAQQCVQLAEVPPLLNNTEVQQVCA